MRRVAVLASGRGSNFEALARADLGDAAVVLLVSDRDDARALAVAAGMGIETALPGRPFERRCADLLEERGIDLVCLAGFMRILRGDLLRRFSGRLLNIHPSLLPAFPGLDAQARALAHGVKVAGCTVHFVDEGADTGPIIMQAAVPVFDSDTVETLSGRILAEEHRIYPIAARLALSGRLRLEGRRVVAD